MAIVRELMGVVASESADGGVVVTSGSFTADAVEFAIRNPIELIDGQQLEKMIHRIQSTTSREPAMQPRPDLPLCPVCGATMVRRTARRGPHTNNPFLGCSRFPQCRGTRQMV
ncbi:MAG: restriction endonuclease [Planctomycetales bacterium]|nr:restriction endonuclease [Planctomycetales bacterium]MCA9209886.1 restriction endonuclease [Planctomycetales bacterium]